MNSNTLFQQVQFSGLVTEIKENTIVLPDFQRGFVWKDKDRQKALIASVLTKLPIGTILLLEIEKDKYACKIIGLKNKKPDMSNTTDKIRALLDGQQRVTVLTAFFSNELYSLGESSDFASPSLARRYFLKLPKDYESFDKKDLFGCRKLLFPDDLKQGKYPEYSTDDMEDWIVCFDKNSLNAEHKKILYGDIDKIEAGKLIDFCMNNSEESDGYLIPLYYLYGAATRKNNSHRNKLELVINSIAQKYSTDILGKLIDNLKSENDFIEDVFCKTEDGSAVGASLKRDVELEINEIEDSDSDLRKSLKEVLDARVNEWARDLREYLELCVGGLELYKIEVGQANILRAIDIYQNLNLGGKALDVFDLILARAAMHSENENLLQVVRNYILQDHQADYKKFADNCADQIRNEYKNFIKRKEEYSASKYLGGWNASENEMASGFCKALMSTVGSLNFLCDEQIHLNLTDEKKINSFTSKVTKSDYLLQIESKRIDALVRRACKGIDRACFFLQMRCAIRQIGEIQYKLIFVIFAVILSEDAWFEDKKICDYLETWYWSAIFSGEFKSEQNAAFQTNLKELLKIIKKHCEEENAPAPDYLIHLCNGVFCDDKFANEDILLVNMEYVNPEEKLSKTICQYYLSKTYEDILRSDNGIKNYEQKRLSVFSGNEGSEQLDKHHIMPIGELSTLYKDVEKQLKETGRGDRANRYNSPLNFAYISSSANTLISNSPLEYYAKYCDTNTLIGLGIVIQNGEKPVAAKDDELKTFLHHRYLQLCASLKEKFEGTLDNIKLDFDERSRSKDFEQ